MTGDWASVLISNPHPTAITFMVSDMGWWEIAARLAPIGTALIALGAAGIAWWAILEQRNIARRRAAIDFFLKTELDQTVVDLWDKFNKLAPTISSGGALSDLDRNNVRAWLNICELIAVGVRKGAFSEAVSKEYWGDVIPKTYQAAKEWINKARTGEGSRHSYADLEELAKKWASKPTPA
jgi:hypothetical protein